MSRIHVIPSIVLMWSLAMPAVCAATPDEQGRGQSRDREGRPKVGDARERDDDRDRGDARNRDEATVVIDRDGQRRVVRDYYSRNALPPGLAKRESLPPGLQKQLRERGTLPPGLQKRLTPVPSGLGGRLPAVPSYYSRYFAGRDLVVVDTRTNRIVSIIPDVIR